MRSQIPRLTKSLAALALTALLLAFVSGCASDCEYRFFTDNDGDEVCGRFCPIDDAEGHTARDSSGEPILGDPEEVARVNCELPGITRSTPTPTSTATPTPSADV